MCQSKRPCGVTGKITHGDGLTERQQNAPIANRAVLLLWRKLSARKFDAIMRPEGFDFSAQIFRKQILEFGVQHVGQHKKLQVGHTAFSIFQSGKRALTGIPACELQFHRKLILIPTFPFTEFANLRPDHIQRNC
jgi:hypothetical protein